MHIFTLLRRMKNKMKAYLTLLKTELKMSLRGMDMLIFAFGMPIVAMFILGAIFGNKPAFDGASYTFFEQSFGALCSISICAGGVMGIPLIISDYRAKKILKRYHVMPVSPVMIFTVIISMYVIYAIASLVSLLALAKVFYGFTMKGSLLTFLGGYLLVMVSIFSIGMMVGGVAKNSQIAGVIASILYFPMLIFSGATIPYEVMPEKLQYITNIMPLTQGIKVLKCAVTGQPLENMAVSVIILVLIAAICSIMGVKCFKWE